jgi:hypothetical protein
VIDRSDVEFCCKLFKGTYELIEHENKEMTVYFNRPYNGLKAISITQHVTLETLLESIKMINEDVDKNRLRCIKDTFYLDTLQEELTYLTRSTNFSIIETPNEYIVSFHLNPNVDRIISKNATIEDVSIMVKSLIS